MPESVKFAYMAKLLESVGERIRRCRLAAKLTQQQLGDAAGVSSAAVSQWESGDTKTLKPVNLFKIAVALNKSAEWLITGKGSEEPRWMLHDAVSELPGDDPQQILDFIGYRFEKAEGFIASDKIAHYMKMIENMKRDLQARKKRSP